METGAKLEKTIGDLATAYGIKLEDWLTVCAFLAPLKYKNDVTEFHYYHSLRVGKLAAEIARFMYLDTKALFLAGLCHDVGKCTIPCETLGNTGQWSEKDYARIRRHVPAGYNLLRDRFDFTAEVILWHHRFQKNGYPKRMPKSLHKYSEVTKLLIIESGRILAIADVYDALHRANSKFGDLRALTDQEIQEKMFELNPDRKALIEALYYGGILR